MPFSFDIELAKGNYGMLFLTTLDAREQTAPKEAATHKPTDKHPLWEVPFRSIEREC
jgi:hypothetical protein